MLFWYHCAKLLYNSVGSQLGLVMSVSIMGCGIVGLIFVNFVGDILFV
jgi:hypothetical protein